MTSDRRKQVKLAIDAAFKAEFPCDTVYVSDDDGRYIDVLVTSRRFDELGRRGTQELMDTILFNAEGVTGEELGMVNVPVGCPIADIKAGGLGLGRVPA